MPLAYDDLDYVDVSIGVLQNIDGDTLAAEVVFEPQFDMAVHTASKNVIYGTQIKKTLSNGSITQRLLASDTRGLSLTNFDWKVTIRATGLTGIAQEKATFERRLRLLRAAPVIDLDILQPVPQPSRPDLVLPVVTSIAGLTGEVTAAQLTAAGVGGSSSSTDPEVVRDVIGGTLVQGQHMSVVVDDAGNTITIGVNAQSLTTSTWLTGAFLQRWRASTAFKAGVPVINAQGQIVTAKADFTSAATYEPADWIVLSSSALDLTPGSTTRTALDATYQQVRPVPQNERVRLPALTKYPAAPIGTLAQVGLGSLYVPWMIRVSDAVFAAYPQYGRWRVYTSTDHDSAAGGVAIGVCDSDADVLDPTKWRWLRNAGSPVMFSEGGNTQTETPCVVWNPDTNLFHLYYQTASGTTQRTRVATSTDGVTGWTVVGDAIKNLPTTIAGWNHTGYAKVWYVDGLWCAWHLQGSGSQKIGGYGWSFSYDGLTFFTDRRRIGSAVQMTDGVSRLGIQALLQWRARTWALGVQTEHVTGTQTSSLMKVWVAPINVEDDFRSLRGRPQLLSWSVQAPETAVASPPPNYASHPDGRLIGAYRVNGASGSIALAVLA